MEEEIQTLEMDELIAVEPKSKNAQIRSKRKALQKSIKQLFETALCAVPATPQSLDRFARLMDDERLTEMREVIDAMKTWGQLVTVVEPKSFLYHAHLQPVLLAMLEDIVKYRDYLVLFIRRFNAENERIDPKHHPRLTQPVVDENGPIHYAVQQLDADFLAWLLQRSTTDVNLRNGSKKTALHMLCERYARAKDPDRLATVRKLIVQLLDAGADFNICCKDNQLPFTFLEQAQPNASAAAKAAHSAFLEQCVQRTAGAIAINSVNALGFHGDETTAPVTVELLEIVLRYRDAERFETFLNQCAITPANVRKMIRLLLHTACEERLPQCFERIVEHGKHEIFRAEAQEQQDTKIPLEPSTPQPQPNQQLVYRVELKGLPLKACEMADPRALEQLLRLLNPDMVLLNNEPLLVLTLSKAIAAGHCSETRTALLACAELLAQQDTVHINKRDNAGNTALHLALKHGLDSITAILLRKPYTFLGTRNRENVMPLDYGTYAFWRAYLDRCVAERQEGKWQHRAVLDLCLDGFNPTPPLQAGEQMTARKAQHTVDDTAMLRKIGRSKELQHLLLHPVLYTFITVKWTRICVWNYLNLVLTASTMVSFGCYSLAACSLDGPNGVLYALSILGAAALAIRELIQLIVLRRWYFSVGNALDIASLAGVLVVLCRGCNGLVSSFVVISFAMQTTFLLGSLHWNSITIMMYMFQTVSINFLRSFLFFLPLIGAFIYAFHLSYNQSPEQWATDCNDEDCAQKSFHSFRTIWNATIKTLVMTTGEFDAASIDFQSWKMLLFVLFLFVAPIVILNLINGLAVSDIAAIRQASELISIRKKVMLLEQYERGIANVSVGWLERCLPKPFFLQHKSHVLVNSREHWNIEIQYKKKILQERKLKRPNAFERLLANVPWPSVARHFSLDRFRLTQFMRLDRTMLDELAAIVAHHRTNSSELMKMQEEIRAVQSQLQQQTQLLQQQTQLLQQQTQLLEQLRHREHQT